MASKTFEKDLLKEYRGTTIFDSCEIEDIQHMEVRADDIWVLSFPRSGTTLTQEIVYMLKSNLDFETAKRVPLDRRFPFLDYYQPEMQNFRGLRPIETMTSPRLIKSHLHRHVLPKQLFESNCKKIYVMRNPKDVVVSCYMLVMFLTQLDPSATINEFFEDWMNNKTYATPWWKHVRDFWKTQNDPSLLVLKYEEIVKDMHGAVKTIADHIDTHVTDDEVQKIVDHCTFEKMKQNASTNAGWMSKEKDMDARFGGHIRRGKVGGWKDFLDPEMSEKVDAMVSEQLGDTDLRFHYGDM